MIHTLESWDTHWTHTSKAWDTVGYNNYKFWDTLYLQDWYELPPPPEGKKEEEPWVLHPTATLQTLSPHFYPMLGASHRAVRLPWAEILSTPQMGGCGAEKGVGLSVYCKGWALSSGLRGWCVSALVHSVVDEYCHDTSKRVPPARCAQCTWCTRARAFGGIHEP